MSEAKSWERPTMAEADTPQVAAESSDVSRGTAASERADERSSARPVKDVVVTVRMTTVDADDLAFVQAELGAASGPDAIREVIRVVAALQRGDTYRSAKAQQRLLGPTVSDAMLAEVRDALRGATDGYGARARQFQAIGNNVNQMAKLANSGESVDASALQGVERALERIEALMKHDAKRDAKVQELLSWT